MIGQDIPMEQSQKNTKTENNQQEDVTIRHLILSFQDWTRYLLTKWRPILIFGLVGGAIGLFAAFLIPKKYVAKLTFVLEDTNSSPLGAYAGIASQFGLDLSGSTSSGVFSGDNIIEFLKSRLMIEKTLLTKVGDSGKLKTLAELYIDSYELRNGWEGKPKLKDLHFPVNADRSRFSLQQDSILKLLYEDIQKNRLDITKPDKKLSFISVECTTKNEAFSKVFTEKLVSEAIDFYVTTKTKRSKTNVDKLQFVADSLESLLNKKTFSVAQKQDINQNPARQLASVGLELATRDKMVLQSMYGEVLKNLEVSKMAMAQETPIIQIVDTPILPLKIEKLGKAIGIILGGFLGGFFTCLTLIIVRLYRKVMID